MNSSWVFNVAADIYAWFTAQPAWRESCTRLARELERFDPDVIVDLGCGPGVSTFELARLLPRSRLLGLDVAPRMLRQARSRTPADLSIDWLRADAAGLPFATASIAACTGHSFLYLVADRTAVLREIHRVLRPGGRLVLMEPSVKGASPTGVLEVSRDPRHLLSVSLWRPFSRLHGRFTPESLTHTLTAAGFVDCRVDETLGGLGVLASAATANTV
jgi:ubiquinone/menaquinone biosynthesis C-methylase UbiE